MTSEKEAGRADSVVVIRRGMARRQARGGEKVKKPKKTESLATVTPLVRSIFDSMFQGQIDEKGLNQKKRRCGICEVEIYQFISCNITSFIKMDKHHPLEV